MQNLFNTEYDGMPRPIHGKILMIKMSEMLLKVLLKNFPNQLKIFFLLKMFQTKYHKNCWKFGNNAL